MSRIIDISTDPGLNVYLVMIDPSTQKFANFLTQAFETYDNANWGDYDLVMAEVDSTGYYFVEIPAWIANEDDSIIIHKREGALPINTDEKLSFIRGTG